MRTFGEGESGTKKENLELGERSERKALGLGYWTTKSLFWVWGLTVD